MVRSSLRINGALVLDEGVEVSFVVAHPRRKQEVGMSRTEGRIHEAALLHGHAVPRDGSKHFLRKYRAQQPNGVLVL